MPLLKDPDAALRRAALLAVGADRNLIADDDLLAWLHDPDPDAKRLCETALRSRGLRTSDLRLGRLLTDPRPAARLELLGLLRDDPEVELAAWLRRLSQDESPAVRAAAARLAGEQQVQALSDRLAQMAQGDPDLTVRPIAGYHLRQLQVVRPVSATAP
jgi:HEAT repeat protein